MRALRSSSQITPQQRLQTQPIGRVVPMGYLAIFHKTAKYILGFNKDVCSNTLLVYMLEKCDEGRLCIPFMFHNKHFNLMTFQMSEEQVALNDIYLTVLVVY
jgi:hypothetical protein